MKPSSTGRVAAATVLLLVLAVFAAFAPALDADFVDWDDDENFLKNAAWRGLTGAHLRWMATSFHMGHWHPLTWLTLALDHALWGAGAHGLHRTNVLLHALAAVAFFFVSRRLLEAAAPAVSPSRRSLAAAFSAAFFALHPLRAESVAWVTERRDVLSGVFFFLTLLAWLRYVAAAPGGERRRAYGLALAFFALGLLSKASLMVLPALLVLLDHWPRPRAVTLRQRVVEKLPFAALSVAAATWAWRGQSAADTFVPWEETGGVGRLVIAGYAAALYTWKTLVPLGLLPLYAMPDADTLMSVRYVAPAVVAVAATLPLVARRRRAPALAFAWIAFLLILAPTSGLAQAGPQIAADRYTYLACTPFALLAAGLVFLWRPAGPIAPRVLAATTVVVALGALTYRQTAVWHDARSLWEYMRAHAPENHHTLGHLAGVRERESLAASSPGERIARLEEASALYERAWELSPLPVHKIGTAHVYRNLAEARPERAAEHLRSALRAADTAIERARARGTVKSSWRRLRGGLLLDQGRFSEAAAELADVILERPGDVTARSDLGIALLFAGQPDAAVTHLQHAVQLEPETPRLWATLGLALEKAGQADAARDAAREVERLCGTAAAPDDPACPAPDRR